MRSNRHVRPKIYATSTSIHTARNVTQRHTSTTKTTPDNDTRCSVMTHKITASGTIKCSFIHPSGSSKKSKGFPYSIPSVGPGADPSVQAVSPQMTVSHPPGGRLSLLYARPAVTFRATQHHCPLAGTKLYCLVTEGHRCEQLAQGYKTQQI